MVKQIVIYDIETLSNCFIYCDINYKTGEFNTFVIHESQNDLIKFYNYLNTPLNQVGFNNLGFDAQVIQWIIDNYNRLSKLEGYEIVYEIYQYSQYVINKSNNNEWLDYPEYKLLIPQLDLFKIFHYNNKARSCSLVN